MFENVIGMPTSPVMTSAISAIRDASPSWSRRMYLARSSAGVSRQVASAVLAAATARSTSSVEPSGIRPMTCSVAALMTAIVLEELARADVSSAILAQLTFNGPPRAIEHLGSDALKERWLPLAATGEALFCIGISETEAGSAVNHMRARLTPDGDGYRLNAYKNYVTGGGQTGSHVVHRGPRLG